MQTDTERIKELEDRLALYEKDPQKRGYFALIKIINQQIDYLGNFDIKSKIGGKPSEDGTFARTQGIWEKLPQMISSLNELKSSLKISKEDEDENNTPFIETIAQSRK